MMSQPRPLGISVLAALAAIGTAFGVLAVTAGVRENPDAVVIGVLLTVLNGLTAYGLWGLRSWAWPLALIVWALGTLDAVRLLTEGSLNTNLIVGPLVLVYLLQPGIRRWFTR